jgi:hypothetical protein
MAYVTLKGKVGEVALLFQQIPSARTTGLGHYLVDPAEWVEVKKGKAINLLEHLRSRFVYTAGKVNGARVRPVESRSTDNLTVHSEQLALVDGQRGHLDA